MANADPIDLYKAQSVTTTNTAYSMPLKIGQAKNASIHIVSTGTLTGTWTVWVTNNPEATTVDDTDWVSLTLAGSITQPAGGASKDFIDLSFLQSEMVRMKFVPASGSGTIKAFAKVKE